MFRIGFFILLLAGTFVGGMLYERAHQTSLCEKSGGQWMRAGFCAAPEAS